MSNILITGGTGVIGKILVREMVKDGHCVLFTSRTVEKGSQFIEEEIGLNAVCKAVSLDFLDLSKWDEWVAALPFPVEAVIHNARSLDFLRPDEQGKITEGQFQKEFSLAVTKPYLLTNALIDGGHPLRDILFISSMYGVVGPTPRLYDDFHTQSPINYGVAKAAQVHLTKELAVRLKDHGIRVNCVSYGGIKGRVNKAFEERYNALTPMGRMLDSHDIYPPVQYIINNPKLAVTGQNIQVDGGWTIW